MNQRCNVYSFVMFLLFDCMILHLPTSIVIGFPKFLNHSNVFCTQDNEKVSGTESNRAIDRHEICGSVVNITGASSCRLGMVRLAVFLNL